MKNTIRKTNINIFEIAKTPTKKIIIDSLVILFLYIIDEIMSKSASTE